MVTNQKMQPSIRWCFTTAWCKSRSILVWRKDTYWFIPSGSHSVKCFLDLQLALLFHFIESLVLAAWFSVRITLRHYQYISIKHWIVLFNDEYCIFRILFVVAKIKCSKRLPVWYTVKIQTHLPTTSSCLLHGVLFLSSCWSSLGESALSEVGGGLWLQQQPGVTVKLCTLAGGRLTRIWSCVRKIFLLPNPNSQTLAAYHPNSQALVAMRC